MCISRGRSFHPACWCTERCVDRSEKLKMSIAEPEDGRKRIVEKHLGYLEKVKSYEDSRIQVDRQSCMDLKNLKDFQPVNRFKNWIYMVWLNIQLNTNLQLRQTYITKSNSQVIFLQFRRLQTQISLTRILQTALISTLKIQDNKAIFRIICSYSLNTKFD